MRFHLWKYKPVYLPRLLYLNGETVTPAASTALTIPSEAEIVQLEAEGDPVYYAINGIFADPNSPGYIADGGARFVGPLAELNTLYVYSASGTVHCQYFRES